MNMSKNIFDLSGKVALVTGGNGGLGYAIAKGLQEAGAEVFVTGRNINKNDAAKLAGLAVETINVTDAKGMTDLIESIESQHGRFDILVNNAGVYIDTPLLRLDPSAWHTCIETNLTAMVYCSKAAAEAMIRAGNGGKIINLGSAYSLFGHPNSVAYAASKTGVIGVTRSTALELGVHGIQVNAILPGWFETDINGDQPKQARGREIRQRTAAGRWGIPDDMKGITVFLASSASNFITGSALPIDGGYSVCDRFLYSEIT